jgi:hypothetical protein
MFVIRAGAELWPILLSYVPRYGQIVAPHRYIILQDKSQLKIFWDKVAVKSKYDWYFTEEDYYPIYDADYQDEDLLKMVRLPTRIDNIIGFVVASPYLIKTV